MKPLQAIIIAILGIVGALYWYSGQQERHYDAAARRYLQQAFADIGSWQRENVQKNLAPQMLAAVDDAQLDALIERYRALGTFVKIDDLQFARLSAALSLFSPDILLSYHGTARFQNGSATLAVTLTPGGGSFHIYNFSLGSPQVLQAQK